MKTMKSVLFFLVAVFCCCKSYAHEDTHLCKSQIANSLVLEKQQAKFEKKYINPNNIHFGQKEISVQLGQEWITTNAVYTDADGFYILEVAGWTCGYCGYYNTKSIWTCDGCGRRRD